MTGNHTAAGSTGLTGQTIISELIRNLDSGRFELSYSVLLPCVFTVYLNPNDHARLAGILPLIAEDAKRALGEHVAKLNQRSGLLGRRKPSREFKIAARDWSIEFLPDSEGSVPQGDLEIHSELNEGTQPGFQGTRTTRIDREPTVTSLRAPAASSGVAEPPRSQDRIFAEIRYEDETGPQIYRMTQNQVRVGRGGDQEPMDLALYTNDEVSREHLVLRRDAATGRFTIEDKSTNGTWLDGKRIRTGIEHSLPDRADIGVAEILTLQFQVRK